MPNIQGGPCCAIQLKAARVASAWLVQVKPGKRPSNVLTPVRVGGGVMPPSVPTTGTAPPPNISLNLVMKACPMPITLIGSPRGKSGGPETVDNPGELACVIGSKGYSKCQPASLAFWVSGGRGVLRLPASW